MVGHLLRTKTAARVEKHGGGAAETEDFVLRPGALTANKSRIVNNDTLARVAALSGLHAYLLMGSAPSRRMVGEYVGALQRAAGRGRLANIGAPRTRDCHPTLSAVSTPGHVDDQPMAMFDGCTSGAAAALSIHLTTPGVRSPSAPSSLDVNTVLAAAERLHCSSLPSPSDGALGVVAPQAAAATNNLSAPKLLADVVEAVLGAVFLDSGGRLGVVWGCFHALVAAAGLSASLLSGA